MKSSLEKILETLLIDEKSIIIDTIENILKSNFSSEIIFEFLNKKLLEINFRVSFNELDTIFKHSCLILNEGLKLKNPQINYISREKNFIDNLNKCIYNNPIKVVSENDLPNRIIYPPNLESYINY